MACMVSNPSRSESVYPELLDWIDRNNLTYGELADLVDVSSSVISSLMRGATVANIPTLKKICDLSRLIFVVYGEKTNFVKPTDIKFSEIDSSDTSYFSYNKSVYPVLKKWMFVRGLSIKQFAKICGTSYCTTYDIVIGKSGKVGGKTLQKICEVTGLVYVIDGASDRGEFRSLDVVDFSSETPDIFPEIQYSGENTDTFVELAEEKSEPVRNDISELLSDTINEAVSKILTQVEVSKSVREYSLNEYQKAASRTIPTPEDTSAMRDHALFGMSSEVGELLGLYQKLYQGHAFDPDHAKKELGDILWMVAEYATAMSWTLEDVAKTNIEKLQKRYPDGFSADKSLHRKEGDV